MPKDTYTNNQMENAVSSNQKNNMKNHKTRI